MKKIISAAALIIAATGASAQASNFGGFSVGLNLNTAAVNTKLQLDGTTLDGIGGQSFNGAVQAAYGFVVSPSAVVTVGAAYGLGSIKAGYITDVATIKAKNSLSVYVEPGYLIANTTLVYGKLSYEKATITATGGDTVSKSINGTGFGFGLRTMLDKASYIQIEVKQIGYGSTRFADDDADFKTNATVGTVGFGYRF
jgi:uncharacterized cupredoxin-like copper-binding protein